MSRELVTLIIDGDGIAWKAASVAKAIGQSAAGLAEGMVRKYMRGLQGSRAYICRSCRTRRYWRHDLWPTYKQSHGERPELIDDAWYGLARVGIVKEFAGMEADDLVGMFATTDRIKGRKIIVADDGDILTIPGVHHRPKYHPPGFTLTVTEADAGFNHLFQTLTGKLADGRPGLPGCSKKTAAKIIDPAGYANDPASQWKAVVLAFERKKLIAYDAVLQARLARICRSDDFDWEYLTVIPWQPPAVDWRPKIYFDADEERQGPPAATPAEPVAGSLFGDEANAEGFKR